MARKTVALGQEGTVDLLSAGNAGQPCVADRETGLAVSISNGGPGTRWFAGWLDEACTAGDVVQIFWQPFGTEGIRAEQAGREEAHAKALEVFASSANSTRASASPQASVAPSDTLETE